MKTKSVIFTKRTPAQDGRSLYLEYSLMTTSAPDGTADYGAAISCADGGSTDYAEICGVTVDRNRAQALVRLLADGTVTPAGMRDVVSDWL